MRLTRRTLHGLPLVVLLAACSDGDSTEPITPPPPLPATPFVVSNPVAGPGGGSVAYLSLPPGTFAEGGAVTLHAPRASSDTAVDLVGGGFDPAPVPAAVGDTLTATVQAGPTAAGLTYRMIVPATAAPVVVRTDPADHQLRVPLDAAVELVFSEPVDLASLQGAFTLSRGGSAIPGGLLAASPGHPERARFTPSDSLAASTTYVLLVGQGAKDASGDSLVARFQGDFTTDTAPTPVPQAPVVTIVRPAAPDTQLAAFTRASVRSISQNGHSWLMELLVNQAADTVAGWVVDYSSSGDPGDTLALRFNAPYNLPPGDYQLIFQAGDTSGRVGASAPLALTFAAPDSTQRLQVLQFFLVEIGDSWTGGFGYAPQLVVADAEGATGVDIVGFELLGFADWPYAFPPMYANQTNVPTDQAMSLFGSAYNDYELYFSRWDGQRLAGPVVARISYRDRDRQFHTWTFQGPVVPRPDTLPPPAVPGRWEFMGVSREGTSNSSLPRRVVGLPPGAASSLGSANGAGGQGRIWRVPSDRSPVRE